MYTKSDLALYRISIVDLSFPVKDVNGYGDYNISFDSEKNFYFFLLVLSAQACLIKVKDFALARTAILGGYRMTACYYVYDLFRACASFGGAFEGMRIDPNVHFICGLDRCLCHLCVGNKIAQKGQGARSTHRQKHWRNLIRTNIAIEYRYMEGKRDRIPELAAELVRLKVDVIVVQGGPPQIRAAMNTTKTIPIIMGGQGSDPVAKGLIDSLAHPGSNVTGLTTLNAELSGKRLELLKEAVPKLSRVAVLYDPASSDNVLRVKEYIRCE
jgi:ABC transporter substrate binding protein